MVKGVFIRLSRTSLLVVLLMMHTVPVSAERYSADWDSLIRHQTPTWLRDAKFGIFVHWGPYSVPAWAPLGQYAEWYARDMYKGGETTRYHTKHYGKPGEFGYKDFIPLFKGEQWDPDAWAELFKQAGARLVIPVAEHHDGFAMWNSELTKWDAYDMGPKRDVIGELEKAVRKRGMKFGASYHRERHFSYFRPSEDDWPWGVDETAQPFSAIQTELKKDPSSADLYGPFHLDDEFLFDFKARWDEIVANYKPDIMWLDDIPVFYTSPHAPQVKKFQATLRQMIAEYLNMEAAWGVGLAVNNKGRREPNYPEIFGLREADYLTVEGISRRPWINSRGIGTSYGINMQEEPNLYPSQDELIELLVEVVSKNGFFLLNVGPQADGHITKAQRSLLLGIGKWLAVNGEGIYGSRPWKLFGDTHYRYTRKGNDLYVFALTWPGRAMNISTDRIAIDRTTVITWLQTGEPLHWTYKGEQAIEIELPTRQNPDPLNPLNTVYCFKISGGARF